MRYKSALSAPFHLDHRVAMTAARLLLLLALVSPLSAPGVALAQPGPAPAVLKPGRLPAGEGSAIVAIVNGDVITRGDVEARGRLLALSAGLGNQPDAIARLRSQVVRQLIDERLRLQEMQRRQIVVQDKQIAAAIADIETRNSMAPGTLRRRLAADGVDIRTMIDQFRVQIGWTSVVRERLAATAEITNEQVSEQAQMLMAAKGQPEFRVGEIFLPATTPAQQTEAERAAETIVGQLRSGAPFPVVAAQFSQSRTALEGGDLGWVQSNQLDPEQLRVLSAMPVGAISNALRVPGGISIVTLRGRREVGNEMALMAQVRQVFFPFETTLDPANPTPQQRRALEEARGLAASAKTCAAMEEAATRLNPGRTQDNAEIRVDGLAAPVLRQLISTQPLGKTSQPIVADDGVAIMMVCDRQMRNVGIPSNRELGNQMMGERIELISRQLLRELHRRGTIELRS